VLSGGAQSSLLPSNCSPTRPPQTPGSLPMTGQQDSGHHNDAAPRGSCTELGCTHWDPEVGVLHPSTHSLGLSWLWCAPHGEAGIQRQQWSADERGTPHQGAPKVKDIKAGRGHVCLVAGGPRVQAQCIHRCGGHGCLPAPRTGLVSVLKVRGDTKHDPQLA
jgi:hypothetical protein